MISQHIVLFRSRAGLTRKELADKVGVTSACIRLIECGKRGMYLSTAVKIAKALNITLDELVYGLSKNNSKVDKQ